MLCYPSVAIAVTCDKAPIKKRSKARGISQAFRIELNRVVALILHRRPTTNDKGLNRASKGRTPSAFLPLNQQSIIKPIKSHPLSFPSHSRRRWLPIRTQTPATFKTVSFTLIPNHLSEYIVSSLPILREVRTRLA